MIYLYESHMGGYYISSYSYNVPDLYCDICGEYDVFLGSFNSEKEIIEFIREHERGWGIKMLDLNKIIGEQYEEN